MTQGTSDSHGSFLRDLLHGEPDPRAAWTRPHSRRLGLHSPRPAPPDHLALALGAVGRCVHFPMGVLWVFLPVFVFSEKLGGDASGRTGAIWSYESERLGRASAFSQGPGLGLSASPVQRPALRPLSPPKGRCASGQGFLRAVLGRGRASPFPAAPGRGRGFCCLTDSSPFFPALPSGSAPPSSQPPPWGHCRTS